MVKDKSLGPDDLKELQRIRDQLYQFAKTERPSIFDIVLVLRMLVLFVGALDAMIQAHVNDQAAHQNREE